MTDVHDLLARTHDALARAEAPLDATRHDDVLSGIRRRRRRRHAGEVLGVGAVVVALGAGGWLGLERDGAPQPAQRPTTTATPTGAATPDPDAGRAPALDAPGLAPALVMPPGTLEAATPGWVLTTQRPSYFSGDPVAASAPSAHVLDLVSPAGERYRVLDLPNDRWVSVVRWEAGSTQALVTTSEKGDNRVATLDLLTGGMTLLDGLTGGIEHVGRTGDGLDLWSSYDDDDVLVHDGQRVVRRLPAVRDGVLDRSGALLAGTGPAPGADAGDGDPGSPLVVDVATGGVTVVPAPADDTCVPFGWSGTEVLLTCWEITPEGPRSTGSLRYDTATPGVAPRTLAVEGDIEGPLGRGVELADGRVVVGGDPFLECTAAWGVVDPAAGTFTRGPEPPAGRIPLSVDAIDGAAYVTTGTQCTGDGGPVDLHRVDLATGATVLLSGLPDTTDLPPDASWISTMTSWTVGTS
ncbi:hypothetical protein [Cellulomonas dongxiuzhuiae]|uniref:hypothetical protein n=1 Tax=Cellulomonas dongxiuzhuiae TaxID=2819979 RepID=UPI001AAE8AC0|nr:hypothetical protein [Cellulomonas dongxiuzhuiae]MBO3089134.1 hypothetical protein [Cellulomonas dongxiuzhuiae]